MYIELKKIKQWNMFTWSKTRCNIQEHVLTLLLILAKRFNLNCELSQVSWTVVAALFNNDESVSERFERYIMFILFIVNCYLK